MFNLPHRPPAKPPHYSRRIELNELSADWVQFRFCHKSFGKGSYFLLQLHCNFYCVNSLYGNSIGYGFHVLKIM